MSGEVEMRDHCPQCGPLTWFGSDIGMIPPHVADEIERLRAERDDMQVLLRGRTAELQAEVERLRAADDALAEALRAMTRLAAPPDMDEWVAWQLGVADPALAAHKEARRER